MRTLFAFAALTCSNVATAETAKPKMIEYVGTCQHTDRFAYQLTRLMDFPSTSSINCKNAKTDWHSTIEFLKGPKSEEPILKFIGKPGPDKYSLEVSGVIDFGLEAQPATGRCQMFRADEPAGKRDIACFVEQKDGGGGRQANMVRFTIDDELLRNGVTKQYSGSCTQSRVSDIVIKELVARVFEEYRPIEQVPTPSCDSAIMIGGKSVSFSNSQDPTKRLVFSGVADESEATRIDVKAVTVGKSQPKKAIAGTCVGFRRMDGFLHTFCSAAFEDNGKIKAVSVEFPEPMPAKD